MFTRQAPQLHTALWLGGLSPAMAAQVQNLLGQCRQPIEHRGPISVNNTLPEPRKVTPEQAKIQANIINNIGGNKYYPQLTLPETEPPAELPPLPPLPPGVRPIFYYIGVPGPKGDPGEDGTDCDCKEQKPTQNTGRFIKVITDVYFNDSGDLVFKTANIRPTFGALDIRPTKDITISTVDCEKEGYPDSGGGGTGGGGTVPPSPP